MTLDQHRARTGWLFLSPALILITVYITGPACYAFYLSLHRWNGLTSMQWVGFGHYYRMLTTDAAPAAALWNNLFLTLAAGIPTIGLALFFAALLHQRIRGAALFRIAFFFPNVLASVAVALIWILLYSTSGFGLFNALLAGLESLFDPIGLGILIPELPIAFASSENLIVAIVPMFVWMYTGFYMVLFLAAMEGIPESYYEAARLEGASQWRQFWHITLPLIRDVLVVACIFLSITAMKFFDPIWVMEDQQPTRDSHVLTTLLYERVFTEYAVGEGVAVAFILFIVVFCATLVTLRLTRERQAEY